MSSVPRRPVRPAGVINHLVEKHDVVPALGKRAKFYASRTLRPDGEAVNPNAARLYQGSFRLLAKGSVQVLFGELDALELEQLHALIDAAV